MVWFPESLTILILFTLILFAAVHVFVIWFSDSKKWGKTNNSNRLLFICLLIYFLFDRNNIQSFILWTTFISSSSVVTLTINPLILQLVIKFVILIFGNYFLMSYSLMNIYETTILLFLTGLLMEDYGKILKTMKIFLGRIKIIRICSFYSC
eukprot:467586_1